MPSFINRTGQVFGRLTVIEQAGHDVHDCIVWTCLCECGNEVIVRGDSLKSGRTRSCGCLNSDAHRISGRRHGAAGRGNRTSEYNIWISMKQRCINPRSQAWEYYGGRGISVCDRWMNSFMDFYYDMGPKPEGLSLDRVDNDGNYEPGNCRWATKSEQTANRRPQARSI